MNRYQIACHTRLTTHAKDVVERRSVTISEILDVLTEPEVTSRRANGFTTYSRGSLTVVCATVPTTSVLVVVTILLRSPRPWTDQDARERDRTKVAS